MGRIIEKESGNSGKLHSKSKASPKINCYKCREKGRYRRFRLQQKKWNFKDESNNIHSVAILHDNSDEGFKGEGLIIHTTSFAYVWILDSCVFYRITFNRDVFKSCRELNGTTNMGDDRMCCIRVLT